MLLNYTQTLLSKRRYETDNGFYSHHLHTRISHANIYNYGTDKDTKFVKLWLPYHTKYIQMTSPYIKTHCSEEYIFGHLHLKS
jgi:hypothetical protein